MVHFREPETELAVVDPDDLLTLRNVTGDESPDFEFAVERFYENVYDCRPWGPML